MLNKKAHDFIYARNTARLTQTEAAKLLDVSRSTVARWESGKLDIPLFKYKAFMACTETKTEDIPAPLLLSKYQDNGYPEGFNPEDYDDYEVEENALKELEGDRHAGRARIRYLLTVKRISTDKTFVDSEMRLYDESLAENGGIGHAVPDERCVGKDGMYSAEALDKIGDQVRENYHVVNGEVILK